MENKEEFERIAKEMIKYLCENHHPHTHVIIDCTTAEISEGISCVNTEEYLKDKSND